MTILRRILGVFVMIAGIIGLVLSLAGLVGIWMAKPVLTTTVNSAVDTLLSSVDISQKTLVTTNEALGATINSVDALSEMLGTTAVTVEDTQPVIIQVNSLLGETLPSILEATSTSLTAAEDAALSLENAIKSFEAFRMILEATPFLSAVLPASTTTYNPEKSLADSLGELSVSIQDMPATFQDISTDLGAVDDNLDSVKDNLVIMSDNVALISDSLAQYQAMISESEGSMDSLKSMLTNIQSSLGRILNITTIVFMLFFLWLLAAQVVIFSQGWELYHGTAGRMGSAAPKAKVEDSTPEDNAS